MTHSQPPITGTTHTLPFDKLSPDGFERLCLWLVQREGYERAEHLGAAGSDQGCDIVAWRGDELWAFQCKRVRGFGPKDALAEVEKVLALPEDERPAGLMFLVTCKVSAETRRQVRKRCGEEMECRFWSSTKLDERVKRHSDILKEFFRIDVGEEPYLIAPSRSIEELIKEDVAPRLACRYWASTISPRKGQEVQVHLLITNRSQVAAKDIHVCVQLPRGYVSVAGHCELSHYLETLGGYKGFPLDLVIRATAENASPAVTLTATYCYGEEDRVEGEPVPVWSTQEHESLWELVDQDQISEDLKCWLESLRPGQPVAVQLQGERGVGKTRVLHQAVEMAREIGYHVFHQICPPGQGPDSPDPLRLMLARGLEELAPDASVNEIVGSIAPDKHVPGMVASVTAYLGYPIPKRWEQWAHGDQDSRDLWVARFIVRLSHHKPVLIVVDDVHRAPKSACRLLRCIAEEARREGSPHVRILVAVSLGAEQASTDVLDELRAITGDNGLWPVPRLEQIGDTRRLIEQIYQNCAFPLDWAEELHELCQGNPLLVLEVVRLLKQEGQLTLEQGYWRSSGKSLRPLLDQVFQCQEGLPIEAVLRTRLPDPDKGKNSFRYLQAMAVLGRELEYEDVDEFVLPETGLSRIAFEDAEDQLCRLGVLAEIEEGLWAITPPILYEIVVRSVARNRRRWRHRNQSAAEYLAAKYRDRGERAAEIAYHFHEAGCFNDAFVYLLKAAEWETRRKDLWRTIKLYEWALEDWPKEHPPEEEGQLRLSLANLYETLGDYKYAQEHLAETYSVFEHARDARGKVEVRIQQGWIAHLRQSDHQALEIYELAQAELDSLPKPHPSQLQRKLWRYHGVSAIRTGQLEKGHQLIMQALTEAQKEANYNELANIYLDVGLSYFKQDMWEEALDQYDLGEKALKRLEGIDDLKVKAKLVASRAVIHLQQHKDELAWAEYEEAIKLARKIAYPDVEAEASYGLGVLYQEHGDLDQAVVYLTHSARTFGRLKKLKATEKAYTELLKTLFLAKRWDELLYEAAYANQLHALSDTGHGYAADAQYTLLRSGRSFTEYPDLFGNAPNEPPDLPKGG